MGVAEVLYVGRKFGAIIMAALFIIGKRCSTVRKIVKQIMIDYYRAIRNECFL